jgi:hypothetical protein
MEIGPYEEMPAVIGNIFFNHRLKIHGLFFRNYSGERSFFVSYDLTNVFIEEI